MDTWAWLALRDQREARHPEVAHLYSQIRAQGGAVYTTDFVLDETYTLLFKRLPFTQAWSSVVILDRSAEAGYLILEHITPARFEAAKSLRLKYDDKPDISFTDLTSMAVMAELGISQIVTGDAHFLHVGMGIQTLP
jgi:predicted nucleic acid-binding protein